MTLSPDSRISSTTWSNGVFTQRSGYGYSDKTTYTLSTNYDDQSLITVPQRVRAYFPEYDYSFTDGVRELAQTDSSGGTMTFQFKKNTQSQILARLHFTPLWYPDGEYTVLENLRDVWTPGGQINMWGSYRFNISGSVYDDWSEDLTTNN
jgi:hypothetical protein